MWPRTALGILTIMLLIGTVIIFTSTVVADKPAKPPGKNKQDDTSKVSVNSGVLSGPMLRFVSTEDVSVSKKKTTISETQIYVEKTKRSEIRTFLKFEVSGITDAVTSAKILLHSIKNSKQGGTITQVSSTNFSEDTMTWQNQPAIDGPVLSKVDAVRSNDYYEWDVTPVITGDGVYAFALTCTNCSASYYSSEAARYLPYLIIVMADNTNISHTDDHEDYVIVGAGDIAKCSRTNDEETAKLLDTIDGTVFTAGDNAYPDGSDADFANCYDPSWGRHKARTNPSTGNHEYNTLGASGYFNYFGEAAGDPSKGYYSYNLGAWHVVVINSNCGKIGGCQAGSPQEQWLRNDLVANPSSCTLGYWHHARFGSGNNHGSHAYMEDIWKVLYDAGADVVIAAHDHTYQRFMPQDPYGVTDLDSGIREFVVGTGGDSLDRFRTPIANSEAIDNTAFGVLKLTLHPTSYEWQFIPIPGSTFTDSGIATCQS